MKGNLSKRKNNISDELNKWVRKVQLLFASLPGALDKKADGDAVYAANGLLGVTTLQIRIPGTVPGVIGTWLTINDSFGEPLYKNPREFTVLNEVDYTKITARGWMHRENGAGCWCEVKENELRVDPAFVPSESETEIVTVAIPAEDSGSQYQKDMLERAAALASKVDNIANNTTRIKNSLDGFSGAKGALTTTGGAIGRNAVSSSGGAAGENAKTGKGFAGGINAKAVDANNNGIDAIQLGRGTNSTPLTLGVYDYQMMDANGNIPSARMEQNVLTKTNTKAYTPSAPYHPATKNYVDGTAEALSKVQTILAAGLMPGSQAYTDAENRRIVMDPASYQFTADDGVGITTPSFAVLINGVRRQVPALTDWFDGIRLSQDNNPNLYLAYSPETDFFQIAATVSKGSTGDVYLKPGDLPDGFAVLGGFGTVFLSPEDGSPYIMTWEELLLDGTPEAFGIVQTVNFPEARALASGDVLTRSNNAPYTPTGDYHPATKKYVDDAVAGSEPEYIDAGGIEQILTGNVLDQYVAPRGEMREYYVRYTDNRMSYNEYLTCKLYSMHYYIPGPGAGGYVQQLDIPFGTSGNGNSDPVSYIRHGDDDSGTLVWYEWEEQIPATKKYVDDAVAGAGGLKVIDLTGNTDTSVFSSPKLKELVYDREGIYVVKSYEAQTAANDGMPIQLTQGPYTWILTVSSYSGDVSDSSYCHTICCYADSGQHRFERLTTGNYGAEGWGAWVSRMFLTSRNYVAYTPTGNYDPATKKYVDDTVGNIGTILDSINGEVV